MTTSDPVGVGPGRGGHWRADALFPQFRCASDAPLRIIGLSSPKYPRPGTDWFVRTEADEYSIRMTYPAAFALASWSGAGSGVTGTRRPLLRGTHQIQRALLRSGAAMPSGDTLGRLPWTHDLARSGGLAAEVGFRVTKTLSAAGS